MTNHLEEAKDFAKPNDNGRIYEVRAIAYTLIALTEQLEKIGLGCNSSHQ